jgi:hypothetical protein
MIEPPPLNPISQPTQPGRSSQSNAVRVRTSPLAEDEDVLEGGSPEDPLDDSIDNGIAVKKKISYYSFLCNDFAAALQYQKDKNFLENLIHEGRQFFGFAKQCLDIDREINSTHWQFRDRSSDPPAITRHSKHF